MTMLQLSYTTVTVHLQHNTKSWREKKGKIVMRKNVEQNKCCIIGMVIISLLPSPILQNRWKKSKYCSIGMIIISLFPNTFCIQFYEGHVYAIHAADQIILQVTFFFSTEKMLCQNLILALEITRITSIRSITTIFLPVNIQWITFALTNVLLVNKISEHLMNKYTKE